ncbi:MAG: beta-phosphoglucomutase [Bacteroidetes bacterium]|nr:beta-phosphoglucomutase [Bacteroidota bacterium]
MKTNSDYKGFIFDLDGVLVSTEHNHFLAWQKTADMLGIDFSEEENENLKGVSRVDSLKYILNLGNAVLSSEEFNNLLDFKNESYLDSIQNLTQQNCLNGVVETLSKAKARGIKLGVGSSSKNAKRILKLIEIEDYFDTVIDGSMVENLKPSPEVFLKAASNLGLETSECLVFEDAASGIQAAKAGGFLAIGIGNENIKHLADHYYNDLTEFTF